MLAEGGLGPREVRPGRRAVQRVDVRRQGNTARYMRIRRVRNSRKRGPRLPEVEQPLGLAAVNFGGGFDLLHADVCIRGVELALDVVRGVALGNGGRSLDVVRLRGHGGKGGGEEGGGISLTQGGGADVRPLSDIRWRRPRVPSTFPCR